GRDREDCGVGDVLHVDVAKAVAAIRCGTGKVLVLPEEVETTLAVFLNEEAGDGSVHTRDQTESVTSCVGKNFREGAAEILGSAPNARVAVRPVGDPQVAVRAKFNVEGAGSSRRAPPGDTACRRHVRIAERIAGVRIKGVDTAFLGTARTGGGIVRVADVHQPEQGAFDVGVDGDAAAGAL